MTEHRKNHTDPAAEAAKGSARSGRSLHGERRVITMLFCDVVGSTTIAEGMDPEEWAEIMNEAFDYLITPISRYEGTLAHLMGDAILAFFGAPVAHENDPQRAVLAGLDIISEIQPFAAEIRREFGFDFQIRVGINTGPVVVGEVGSGQTLEYTAMGDAVNLASRMETSAAPGTVQISEYTYKLVAPLFEVEELGPIQVKGKTQPVKAYRVLEARREPGRMRGLGGLQTPLVGRERHLQRFRQSLDDLKSGKGTILFLVGEAGLGKSRLLSEFRSELERKSGPSLIWHESTGSPYDRGQPYSLAGQLLRQLCSLSPEDEPEAMISKIDEAVAILTPERRENTAIALRTLLLDRKEDPDLVLGAEAIKNALLNFTIAAGTAQLASGGALVFDDLHWADNASIELLNHIFQTIHQAPVLFLCAMRPYRDTPGWRARQEAETIFAEQFQEMALSPLNAEASDELVESLTDSSDLPRKLRELIHRKAEGNPYYVEEIVRSLVEIGAIQRDAAGRVWRAGAPVENIDIPDSLQGLLISRIDRLAQPTKHTLQLAAVIGRYFYQRILAAIDDAVGELGDRLAVLQGAELILESAAEPEMEYMFRHELAWDAAYHTILIRQRRRHHRRVAEAIERLMADRLNEEAHRLAHHFREGRVLEKALEYAVMAGDTAARLYANAEAADHFMVAIEIARELDAAEHFIPLYTKRGRTLELDGRYDDAIENYNALEELGQERRDDGLVVEGLLARALIRATMTSHNDPAIAAELLERALEIAERIQNYDALSKIYWLRVKVASFTNASPEQVLADGEHALAIARQHKLKSRIAYILNDMALVYSYIGQAKQSFETMLEAGQIFKELSDMPMYADTRTNLATGMILMGRPRQGLEYALEGLVISSRIGNPWGQSYSLAAMGLTQYELGHLGASIDSYSRSIPLSREAGFGLLPMIIANLTVVYLYIGDLERASAVAAELATEGQDSDNPIFHIILTSINTMIDLERGEIDSLEILPLDFSEAIGTLAPVIPAIEWLFSANCKVHLARGEYAQALANAQGVLEILEMRQLRSPLAQLWLQKGLALRGLGRIEEAIDVLRGAAEECRELENRRTGWVILDTLSELEAAAGNQVEGDRYREEAAKMVRYILDHIDDKALEETFRNKPQMQRVLNKTS